MNLTVIVSVFLRVSALQVALNSFTQSLLSLSTIVHAGDAWSVAAFALWLIGTLAGCGLLWVYSERLSAWICGAHDTRIELLSITTEDLFTACMVFVGLQLFVQAVPSIVNYAHYFLRVSADPAMYPPNQRNASFYDLSRFIMQAAIGFGLIGGARTFSRRLTRHHGTKGTDRTSASSEPSQSSGR